MFGLAALVLATVETAPEASCPISPLSNVTAVIYVGDGATAECRQWEADFYSWAGIPAVKLSAAQLQDPRCGGRLGALGVSVFAMPGGNAYNIQTSAGAQGKAHILSFIDGGGLYVGTCAGFFYASSGYYWQAGKPSGGEYQWPNLLYRFPETEGSITTIQDDDIPPGYTLTGLDNGLKAIYWGGPTRGWRSTPATVPGETLLRFADVPGRLPAAVHVNDADGNRLLFSVHLEAEEGVGISNTGLTRNQTLANWQFRATAIGAAAGLSLNLPSSLPEPSAL